MANPQRSRVIRLAQAQQGVPGPDGKRALGFLRGTLDVKLSMPPARPNQQTPHAQDEIYVVVRGRGILVHDGERDAFESGDLLFVAAGVEHHFEEFDDDLTIWRVFYGPQGGEIADSRDGGG
jgi:mannose-6-phosphate isomerase-like protein (cupin superfamily)